jgi:hypothetical protein
MMVVLRSLREEFSDFCSTISIQGLRNVGDSNQGFCSRLLWLVVVAVSFVLAGICIKESLEGEFSN